jgi:predicted ATPase
MPATTAQALPATTFGDLLRHLRQRARMTQDELGLAVGYSRAHIARLENNQRLPDPSAVRARFFEPLDLKPDSSEAAQLVSLATAAHGGGGTEEAEREHQTPNNLPYPVTSFVGRTEALAELQRLLPTTRLLTLTGVGGTGKTRLALELASRVLDDFPDGVWLVELAPVADPALVAQTVLSVLNTRDEVSRPPVATLVDHLGDRQLLLVFDNCEHVITACASLSEAILRGCRNVHILATSREALVIQGELSWTVPSLSVPSSHELTDLKGLGAFEAIQLFTQRAAFAAPGFALSADNASAVRQICIKLDGIPLAVELAASRVKVMSPQAIAERLDDCFRLLTGGSRTALPRHQTLTALIDWSYRLLTEQERSLLRRLSVFANGWTIEAAGHVGSGPDIQPDAIEETLFKLIDKSLVSVDESGAITRYRLLNTIRQYAADRLDEAHETSAIRDQHLSYFLEFGIRLKPALYGMTRADQLASVSQVAEDLGNVRLALDWAIDSNRGKDVLDLVDRYFVVFLLRGVHAEDRRHLQRLLDRTRGLPPSRYLAEIVVALVRKHRRDGDPEEESRLARELVTIASGINDPEVKSWAMAAILWSILHRNEIATARSLFEPLMSYIEDNRVLTQAELSSARTEIGNWLDLFEGQFEQAAANLESEYAAAKSRGVITEYSRVARQLGYAHLGAHNLAEAQQRFRDSLLDNRVCEDAQAVASCLAAFAALAHHTGDFNRSARLFGAAEKCHELNRSQPMQLDRMLSSSYLKLLRGQMNPDSFAEAWQAGRAMTVDQAITCALEW